MKILPTLLVTYGTLFLSPHRSGVTPSLHATGRGQRTQKLDAFVALKYFLKYAFPWEIHLHRVPNKGNTKPMAVTLLILNPFAKKFTIRFSSKFAAKYSLKIQPHLICVATIPCETLMSENERQLQTNAVTINYKVQYVHIYDVVRFSINKIIKQGLLLSLLLKIV